MVLRHLILAIAAVIGAGHMCYIPLNLRRTQFSKLVIDCQDRLRTD